LFDKADLESPEGYAKIIAAAEKLTYPPIVKPSNLGSSIGISVCRDRAGLNEALDVALQFDNRILIERALEGITEINCSVCGGASVIHTSQCEQPLKKEEILSFADKYLKDGKKSMAGMSRLLPAPISDKQSDYIRRASQKVFAALGAKGVIRIDYIIHGDAVYINEANTIPGSLSYYLWEYEGISFGEHIDKFVEYALAEHRRKASLTYAYESNVLSRKGLSHK